MMKAEDLKKSPFNLSDEDLKWVVSTWEGLSDEEKAGQMFLPLCPMMTKENMDRVLKYRPGGVHRFASLSAEDLRSSAAYLQENSAVPLLLTGDLEFGTLGTIGVAGTSWQTQLGTAASRHWRRDCERMARIAAREGLATGFNWTFSPVVDINYNFRSHISATRSFGSDPAKVAEMGRLYVKALQEEGMAACAKHWPGDGMDERDQHLVTTHNTLPLDRWMETYGRVYRTMIDQGVMTVMSAHITLAAWDRELNRKATAADIQPATLSANLNVKLLREKLGFNGVIISDATGMAGLTSRGPREKIVPAVINGGCDIFLFSVDDEEDFGHLLRAMNEGVIPAERVREAVYRILALKAALGLHKKEKRVSPQVLGCEEHARWREECLSSSITLVKDTQKLIPVDPGKYRRVLLIESEPVTIFGPPKSLKFREYLEKVGFEVSPMTESTDPSPGAFDLVIYLLNSSKYFGKGTYFADWPSLHRGTMRSMIRTWDRVPTMMISLSNPYHLFDAPLVKTYINAYSPIEEVQEKLVRLITGMEEFRGENPVDPFCGLEEAVL